MRSQNQPVIDTASRDAFLELFEPYLWPALVGLFMNSGPLAGIVMPDRILAAVVEHLRFQLDASTDCGQQNRWRDTLVCVAENWDTAEAFANYCVQYSALPDTFRKSLHEADAGCSVHAIVHERHVASSEAVAVRSTNSAAA